METVMSLLLVVLVHLLVIASIGAMLFFLRYVILKNPDAVERLLRVAASALVCWRMSALKLLGSPSPS